jgi:hypothetical protein
VPRAYEHRFFPSLAAITLALSCSFACGGQSNGDAQGGTSSTGGAGSGGQNVSGGRANASGGASCNAETFADDRGWSVSVTVINQTGRPLHLGQDTITCGVSPLFRVEDGAGALLPELGDCRQSCESVAQGSGVGCPALCRFPEAITLAPAEGTSLIWTGLYRTEASVPAVCSPSGPTAEPVACDRARQIEPGTFRFIAAAGSDIDCSLTIGDCTACEARGVGGCATPAALISGARSIAEATVDLDASYGVGPRGGNGSDGATRPVELVFKD